jgi:DNA mismatch repair protein MutL
VEQAAPESEPETPWRVAGEVLNTYIIVEQGETILFIDKHAAHERMWFDKLKSQDWKPMAQVLLSPVVFTPAPEEGAVLLEHLPLLEEFGFQVEDFGGGALIVRQVPHDIDPEQAEQTLTELAARLLTTGGRADPAAARDALLHTMACKAAIKGGQKNGPAELQRVAQAVLSGAVQYCPHGRPVAIELTRASLEKQFKRA